MNWRDFLQQLGRLVEEDGMQADPVNLRDLAEYLNCSGLLGPGEVMVCCDLDRASRSASYPCPN